MDLLDAIYDRRSIRKYTQLNIEKSELEKILDAARWAPNSGNNNAWRFIVVTSPTLKQLLLNYIPGVYDMPAAIIVICIEPHVKRVKEATRLIYMADAAIASENIALAAQSLGIGNCIVASFADIALKTLLDLPENIDPYIVITLGYPDESPEPPPRLPINKISFIDEYGKEW